MASNVATPLERQFSLIPGITQMTSVSSLGSTSITLQFELSQNIDAADFEQVQAAINAASGQLPTNLPSAADHPQGQPGRRADHDPRAHLRHPAARHGRRLRRHHPLAADLADRRRRPGHHRRPAEAGRAHPASTRARSPRSACSSTASARRSSPPPSTRPKGSINGPQQDLDRLRQRPDPRRRRRGTTWSSATTTARRSASTTSAAPIQDVENNQIGAWVFPGKANTDPTLKAGQSILLIIFKEPGANVIKTVDRIRHGAAGAAGEHPAGDQRSTS